MKTTSTFLLFCLTIVNVSFCQIDSTRLDHNNVSAFISDDGTYFLDYSTQNKGYEVPKGSGKHAINTTQFWFAAKDASNEIHFVQGGIPNQGTDVFNGPISDPGTYNTPEYQNDWSNSTWSICQSDIDQFKLNWLCDQDPNCSDYYPLSNEAVNTISSWPAHGDNSLGQSFYLAPFMENSNNIDGIYDAAQGDYPVIKGCCAVYMIQNDAAQAHTLTNTNPIGIELHIMFYQYRTWDYLNDVTFVDIVAINRSNVDYPEFLHSIVVDADIGNDSDDYFGSDSLNNCMYFYNADNNDEDGSTNPGYGVNPPAIGVVGLNKNMTSCVPYTSGGGTVFNKWNLMKGLQENGSPWLRPNSNETQYVFSGNPNNPSDWSALGTGSPVGEAKGVLSLDYGSFNSGDTLKQSYAIVYARDGDHLDNVQSVIDNAVNVKAFYDNESDIPCNEGTWNLEELNELDLTIAPNPSTGIIHLSNPDKNLLSLTVYNPQGKVIEEHDNSNKGVIKVDLSNQSSGVYFFHINTENAYIIKKIVVY
jgi:hypothetical protein